jgi:hypothetical protein
MEEALDTHASQPKPEQGSSSEGVEPGAFLRKKGA